ncbi:hypothetical protein [Streptomyces sp. NPDC057702]|uniref:hypothetical protein n=1 Tax=unclassified Streptomyces TaxID=2593676 RepID=UPI0036AB786A
MRDDLVGRVVLAAGVALVPWLAVLWITLPDSYSARHWRVAWVGFDALEIAALLTSAVLVRRGGNRAPLALIATAVLLLVDAWFDVMTAGRDVALSVTLACALELPVATWCAVAALRPPGPSPVPAAVARRGAVRV